MQLSMTVELLVSVKKKQVWPWEKAEDSGTETPETNKK